MPYMPDYNDLYDRYQRQQESELARLPKCSCCGEAITDEHFYLINDEKICQACLDDNHRRFTDDYIE